MELEVGRGPGSECRAGHRRQPQQVFSAEGNTTGWQKYSRAHDILPIIYTRHLFASRAAPFSIKIVNESAFPALKPLPALRLSMSRRLPFLIEPAQCTDWCEIKRLIHDWEKRISDQKHSLKSFTTLSKYLPFLISSLVIESISI